MMDKTIPYLEPVKTKLSCVYIKPTNTFIPGYDYLQFNNGCEPGIITAITLDDTKAVLNGHDMVKDEEYMLFEGDKVTLHDEREYVVRFKTEEDNGESSSNSTNDLSSNSSYSSSDSSGKRKRDEYCEAPSTSKVSKLSDLAPIFKPIKIGNVEGSWETVDDALVFTPKEETSRDRIAAFDLDGTLIKPKSGKRFPEHFKDWMMLYTNIRDKLHGLASEYKIVIFTNQATLSDTAKISPFKGKIQAILNYIDLPIQVFIATKRDIYRKPCTGLWTLLEERNNGIAIDKTKSFYVGDAAGRVKDWAPKMKKDHSTADRLFALNLGLEFFTPEEYFQKKPPAKFEMPSLIPAELPTKPPKYNISDIIDAIILVGSPGSGKSTFARQHLVKHGYRIVSRDILGSIEKCLTVCREAIAHRKRVVVDNTHRDKSSRSQFIECFRQAKYPVRCFYFKTSKELCKHNNKFRELTDTTHAVISDMLINSYYKNFEEPSIDEGFNDIVEIEFSMQVENPEHETLYKSFILE